MSIRRQAYQWEIKDLGQLPAKRLEELTKPQSIFTSGFGNATLKARLRTKPTEYVVIKYFGSTPHFWNRQRLGSRDMSISKSESLLISLIPMEDPPRFVGKCRPLPNFHKIWPRFCFRLGY